MSDPSSDEVRGRRLASRFFGSDPDPAFRRRALWIGGSLARHFRGRSIRLLDVGCGRGYYFPLFEALAIRADGVDVDRDALEVATARFPNACVCAADAASLPYDDGVFDGIVMSEVLEHLADPVQALREANRVMKPGGLLLASVPSADYPFLWDPLNWMLERTFGRHIAEGALAGIWANHLRLYSEADLRTEFGAARFTISALERQTRISFPFVHNLVYGLGKTLVDKDIMADIRHEPDAARVGPLSVAVAAFLTVSNSIDGLNREREPVGAACVNLCVAAVSEPPGI